MESSVSPRERKAPRPWQESPFHSIPSLWRATFPSSSMPCHCYLSEVSTTTETLCVVIRGLLYVDGELSHLCFRLLPATDGGRVALAVFGRGAKLLIGNVFLLMLLFVGFLGSDLFLFYFGFIVLFQTGNEIAARNEVDKVEFSRVALAIAANVLMLLTLIPFQ